ncbi:KCTD1_15 [Mytilus edulis]|uniref:KCTD1_15 n=1 Tax=Mytilus edulis TaxID=6550 RepID=A0A8S3VMY5_MYTED|nr:KCTD1_15 [Mytilus edulis]
MQQGKDFLRVMSKIDFDVSTDTDGRKYVWLKYHPKFSFKELVGGLSDNEPVMQGSQVGEKMYERPGDHRCPVASFQKYVSHLHPMTEMFWQRPKRSFVASDLVWYDNTPLGNSTLSKIMTRMCSMAGLTENYTNHAIKSTYIPLIEKMCKDALSKGSEDACMTDVSSVCSDVKDEEENPNSGLRQAKMKVLETVHGLEVKDIRTFVDWLKTFRVELDGGGLVVMCSPVDQSRQTSMDSRQGSFDDPRSRQNSMDDFNRSIDSPSRNDNRLPNGNQLLGSSSPIQPKRGVSPSPLIKPTISLTKADSIEKSDKEFSVSVRQFDFDTSSGTHCASMENLKMTVPSQDTVLMTGIPESVQVLVHNRDGSPMISEPVQSRLFYSSNDMDIAVVSALLGERNSLKNNIPNTGAEKSDYYSKLLDKFKPMKKRSLSDLVAGTKIDGDDDPAKKKFASTEGLEPIHASMATQSQPVSKPVTINTQLLPVMVSQPSQLLPRHLLPSKAINAQPVPLMISHHHPLMANTQPMPLMTTEPVSVHTHNMLSKAPAFQNFIQNKSLYKREDNPAYFPVRPGLMKMKMDPKPK